MKIKQMSRHLSIINSINKSVDSFILEVSTKYNLNKEDSEKLIKHIKENKK
jgi:hypothetical protein